MNDAKSRPSRRNPRAGHAALALVAALAATGCPAKPVFKNADLGNPYKFTIGTDAQGCPTSALADWRNCDTSLRPNDDRQPKDCIRARSTEPVVFASASSKPLDVQFDPFRKSTLTIPPGGATPAMPLLKPKAPGTRYYFAVSAQGCNPLDPQIIVEW